MIIDETNIDIIRRRSNSVHAGTALVVIEEALERKIKVELPFDNFKLMWLYLHQDSQPIEVRRTMTHQTSPISTAIAIDKSLCYQVAKSVGMKRLPWIQASSGKEAIEFYRKHDGMCIIKPSKGQAGRGIITTFDSEQDFLNRFKTLNSTDRVVIQVKATGKNDLRLLFIGNKFVAATITRCSEIIGNGMATFEELLHRENAKRSLGNQSRHRSMLLKELNLDEACNTAGIALNTVLKQDQIVIASLSNATKGGIAADATEIIHPSFIVEASKLVKRLNIPVVAIDFICGDIILSRHIDDSNAYFLEANSSPGLDLHMYPHEGKGVNVAGLFIEYLKSHKPQE